jgi:hypothetical protein
MHIFDILSQMYSSATKFSVNMVFMGLNVWGEYYETTNSYFQLYVEVDGTNILQLIKCKGYVQHSHK